jgi:hypothetical protein
MSLGRCEDSSRGEAGKDKVELSREELEDVDGVGCRSLAWSNGQAMGNLKGRGRGERGIRGDVW